MRRQRAVFSGADVWLHDETPHAAPRDVLVENGRIAAIGARGSLLADSPEPVVLLGGLLMPAFFDGHLHLEFGGKGHRTLQLADARSSSQVLRRVAGHAAEGRITGLGLHEDAWPSIEDLNRAAGKRTVLLHTRDYHSAFLSRAGMEALGITTSSPVPEGGTMERDANGEPTGVFRENAVSWIESMLPEEGDDQRLADLEAAFQHLVSLGVVGVSSVSTRDDWLLLERLDEEGRLPIRVESWGQCLSLDDACLEMPRGDGDRLRRSRIKVFLDGAMGSRTAWMRQPYSDDPSRRLGPVPELKRFKRLLERGVERGWSFTVHAIGDAAVALALEVLSDLPAPGGPHRVEHVQHVDEELLCHPAWEEIIPSIQPSHRTADLGMLTDRVGRERAALSFPARSLWRGQRPLVLGTDWPVVTADPLETIRSAISSRGDGEGMPGEELSVAQAIEGTTRAAAQGAGFEKLGEIAEGAPADLVWLDPNPLTDGWMETKVRSVWRSGERIYASV